MEESLKVLCKCGSTIGSLKKAVNGIDEKYDSFHLILCGEDKEFSIWIDDDAALASIENDEYIKENVIKFNKDANDTKDEFAKLMKEDEPSKYHDYNALSLSNMIIKVGDDCYWLEFTDVRVDRDTVPENLYVYEIAGDDDSGAEPCRLARHILVNFWGTVFCTHKLKLDNDGYIWIDGVDNRLEFMS